LGLFKNLFGAKKSAERPIIEEARAGNWDYLRTSISPSIREAARTLEETMTTLAEMEGKGWTSLHAAANRGDENTMALVLLINSDVNAADSSGLTPLHIAAVAGYKEVASLLISAGARVDAKDNEAISPLHCAAMRGHKQMTALLIDNGADVNSLARGITPLMFAEKYPGVCALLRKRGAR
jgi:ankyrin repeat protein